MSLCVGLVALLNFLALVCVLAKNANVLPKALVYFRCLFINIVAIKNILTKTSTIFHTCLPNAILKNGWNNKASPMNTGGISFVGWWFD